MYIRYLVYMYMLHMNARYIYILHMYMYLAFMQISVWMWHVLGVGRSWRIWGCDRATLVMGSSDQLAELLLSPRPALARVYIQSARSLRYIQEA